MGKIMRAKRLLSLVLAMILVVSTMGVQAFASEGSNPPPPPDEAPPVETGEAVTGEQEQTGGTDVPADAPVPGDQLIMPVPEDTGSGEVMMEELEDQMAAAEAETEELPPETEEEAAGEEELVSDDPLYWKSLYGVSTIAGIPSFAQANPRALKSGEVLRKGVDVSEFQVHNKNSYDINWAAAKASGIDFAIIRAGYRGASYGTLGKDAYFDANIKAAKAAGLKVGAYIYSQAITPEEARAEAIYLISLVKNYQIDLPLVFDYEETTYLASRRLVMSKLSRQTKTDICNAFCDEVEKNGYQSMVYCNLSMVNNDIYRDQIGRLWLAHWTAQTSYTGDYEYWQIGDGAVSGFNGTVDLDFWFDPSGGSVQQQTQQQAQQQQPQQQQQQTQPEQQQPQQQQQQTQQQQQQTQPEQQQPPTAVYTDVKSGAWYYNDIQWATGKGIVSGVGNNTFAPNDTATRGQVVTMIYRLKGSPAVSSSAGFTDLTQDYYKNAVNWAAGAKVVTGTGDTTFSPNGKITRQDLVTMLYRLKGSPAASGSLSTFTDKDSVKSYALGAMVWAVNAGIIKGYSNNTIGPGASATRAEVCTMLKRFADLG